MATIRQQKIVISPAIVQLLGVLFLLVGSPDVHAGVYKCVDAEGSITYAQTPCPDQITTTIHTASTGSETPLDCKHAGRFALNVARSMKSGNASSDTYMAYGGVDAMSKAAINIVNYVHSFQHSRDVTEERIAALANSKCQARAFGEVSCESLPRRFTEAIGSCDKENDGEEEPELINGHAMTLNQQPGNASTKVTNARNSTAAAQQKKLAAAREADQRKSCRERHENEIDRINDSMRRGFTSAEGEKFRNRLRTLRKAINDC